MVFLISFLEGIVTFVSPCVLPLLPVYLAYFAGGAQAEGESVRRTIANSIAFVLGFSVVFVALGTFSGTLGSFLNTWKRPFDIACGAIVVVFGLNYLGVLRIGALNRTVKIGTSARRTGVASSAIMGVIFAAGWTPCIGAFLGSALALAAQQGSALVGFAMLVCYSLGLGIPFVLCAVLIRQLEGTLSFVKRHYTVVNTACGGLLVVVGLLMATGLLGTFLSTLSL